MHKLIELSQVEETRHLMPNLPIFQEALFGKTSYFLERQPGHMDWATKKSKRADGFVWLPWRAQLWIVEVEWKEDSNFFDQSRAFAKSKVNWDKLNQELRKCLHELEPVLDKAVPSLRDGHLVKQIIDQTKQNHYEGGYLKPHCWVLLGHKGNNIDKLCHDYEEELKSRFTDSQHYILTMTRMFHSNISSYALMTQHYSQGCHKLIETEKSILVPVILDVTTKYALDAVEVPVRVTSESDICTVHSRGNTSQLQYEGRAGKILKFLKTMHPDLERDMVRLRIQLDQNNFYDFMIDWEHTGKLLMVFSRRGIHQNPADAAKEVFGQALPPKIDNIARQYGKLIDISGNRARVLISYAEIDRHLWPTTGRVTYSPNQSQLVQSDHVCTYFDSINSYKQRKISENIFARKPLWREFVSKGHMTSAEFKQLSHFEPKAITGFMRFLTFNRIASRFGDVFTLNNGVMPHIKKLLNI